jgi:hypothetical protein
MAVTDADQTRAIRLILADMEATLGPGYEPIAYANAERLREFIDDPDNYVDRVVEDTQQDVHDEHIDTDWPPCPRHGGRHPLWLGDGGWRCETDGVVVAAIGDLRSVIGRAAP